MSGSNCLIRIQTWYKAMGWYTTQWKMLLFCAKTIVKESHNFELAQPKKMKKMKMKMKMMMMMMMMMMIMMMNKKKKKKKKKKEKKKKKRFWPSGDSLVRYFHDAF